MFMNEIDFLKDIKMIIGNDYIGDDCAYIKEHGIVISQDNLVENVHFKRDWCTPYQLGYKSIAANISDILASGAEPAYISIALSLPDNISENFVREFYKGATESLYGAQIIGGDITGSLSDIFVSVTAIGKTAGRNIASRKNAKAGYKIITKGNHGQSAAGLEALRHNDPNLDLILEHLEPKLEYDFSKTIATMVKEPYAMMDTSDGLADALFKIADDSQVTIEINFESIPHADYADYEKVLFGGEDYKLVAAVPEEYIDKVEGAVVIGEVKPFDGTVLNISGQKYNNYFQLKVFNHFGVKYE